MSGEHRPATGPDLRVTVERVSESVCVVRPVGDMDMDRRHQFAAALDEAMQPPAARVVVVDLAGLGFCDSTGVNALLTARTTASAAGIRLVVAGPSQQMLRLLEATGADEVFDIEEDVDAALNAADG
ncbi:STAS domain-containing protein [Kitasatospora sp. NPDC059646]|uniref:STAS domain-containing protein n=1 Tax=Kitasatospora sp. NPDC059646 TaxID=3346893 RepID=UPI003693D013